MRTYWETYDQVKEESTERTPTQIVVWVAVTSRHQASGLPSLSSQQGEGVQHVFIFFLGVRETRVFFDARRPFHCGGGAQSLAL